MIRITTQGRYALRAMVDLAMHAGDGPVARQEIAARQAISADYVAQLFLLLQDADLVEGVKGPGGGYRLIRDPDQVCVREIVEAVEGPIALVHCVDPYEEPACNRVDLCPTRLLWQELSGVMREFLDAVTLQSVVDDARRLSHRISANGEVTTGTAPSPSS